MNSRWDPWAELRARTHLTLEWADQPCGGIVFDRDGKRTIQLDRTIGRVQRRVVLGHELVHDELDLLFSEDTPPHIIEAAERRVWRIVVERMVPPDRLLAFVARRATVCPVTPEMVAEEFDVTAELAELAMHHVEDRLAA